MGVDGIFQRILFTARRTLEDIPDDIYGPLRLGIRTLDLNPVARRQDDGLSYTAAS